MNSASEGKDPNALPFVAPCQLLAVDAPFRWLAMAWQDIKQAPRASLAHGFLLCLLSYAVTAATFWWGNVGLYLGLVSGFVFVAPALAMTFYAISEGLAQQRAVGVWSSLIDALLSWKRSLVLAVLLVVVLLIWARAANTLYIFYPQNHQPAWSELGLFLGIGTVVGALFSAVVFAMSAFSLPMLMDRKVDAVTAVVTSINAVLRNKKAMLVWSVMIVACVISGILTAWLSFIVVMPLIGHATWHAYQHTIDASDWPSARPSPSGLDTTAAP